LEQLGLDTRQPPAPDLRDFLQRKAAERARTVEPMETSRAIEKSQHAPTSQEMPATQEFELQQPEIEPVKDWRCLRCGEVVANAGPPVQCRMCKTSRFKPEAQAVALKQTGF